MKSVFEENKEITSVIGEHKFGKNDTDVEVFFITDSSRTKYVPTKVCGVLSKLTKFDIYGTSLIELKKDIFDECADLKKIVIKYIKLKTLDEDLFTQVENLESFVLGFTHVEVLPQKLFANNQKLKFLDLSFNKLKQITTEFPNTLTMLSLMNNDCIDGHYDSRSLSGTTTMEKLVKDTYKKCAPNKTTVNTNETSYEAIKASIIEEQINENEKKLNTLETEIENLEAKMTNKIDENLRTLKAFKSDANDKIENIKKEITGLEKTSKDQSEKFMASTNQLQTDSRNIKLRLEKNEDLKRMSGDLRAEINRNENLLVTLFCFQLVMIAAAIFFGVYKNCYSNRNHGARLVNDQTNPNF
jgi:DNA repair exonuclease SbcCD ATPase subunit